MVLRVWYLRVPRQLGVSVGLSLALWGVGTAAVLAQTPVPVVFPVNPLDLDPADDPLLPKPAVNRPFSPLERRQLITELNQLHVQAQGLLAAQQPQQAFETWYRELRLRRVLGLEEELKALGRVGAIAWGQTNNVAVRAVTRRLEAIQGQLLQESPRRWPLIQLLGAAYQQVRSPGQALVIYNQILAEARNSQDQSLELATLRTIADLHFSWFDYDQAAIAYQELLKLAQTSGDRANQIGYLQQLILIYDRAGQTQNAIESRLALIPIYTALGQPTEIPPLYVAIAQGYESLGQFQAAANSYEAAYTASQALQQWGITSQALQGLAKLYQSQNQLDAALEVYRILLLVDSRAYNTYGMMNSYDQIAQINIQQNNYPQALDALQRGLRLAEQLRIRRNYFQWQIEKLGNNQ